MPPFWAAVSYVFVLVNILSGLIGMVVSCFLSPPSLEVTVAIGSAIIFTVALISWLQLHRDWERWMKGGPGNAT